MSEEPVEKEACRCPICDAEMKESSPICRPCAVVFVACSSCGAQVREGLDLCPECGESPA